MALTSNVPANVTFFLIVAMQYCNLENLLCGGVEGALSKKRMDFKMESSRALQTNKMTFSTTTYSSRKGKTLFAHLPTLLIYICRDCVHC